MAVEDYRLFLGQNEEGTFCGKETGDLVDGYDPRRSLLTSSLQLVELIKDAGLPQADEEVERIIERFRSLPNILDPTAPPSPAEDKQQGCKK